MGNAETKVQRLARLTSEAEYTTPCGNLYKVDNNVLLQLCRKDSSYPQWESGPGQMKISQISTHLIKIDTSKGKPL